MDKIKFTMSKEEMLEFNDNCESVSSLGPKTLSQYEDREILLGEVKSKDLVRYWIKDPWLKHNLKSVMHCSHAIHLGIAQEAEEVRDVFKKYKLYLALKKLSKENTTQHPC